MNSFVKPMIASLAFAITNSALALGTVTGLVGEIRAVNGGNGVPTHVRFIGSVSGKPACATNTEWWMLNTTTAEGRAILGTIMTAAATGKSVIVWGTNTCNLLTGYEDIYGVGVSFN